MVARLVAERGWQVAPGGRHSEALAAALDALRSAGQELPGEALAAYADAMSGVAEQEIASMSEASREDAATYAVTGTVLAEPVLLTLRRMVHEHLSVDRFSARKG